MEKKAKIHGTIEKIVPLENNQALVINKVILYAVRLFEYDPQTGKLTELKRYVKNKVGYSSLESALEKVRRIIEAKKNNLADISDNNSSECDSVIEILPKN